MGLVVPIWIWLPVVMWFLWRYERGKRVRLEERYHLGMQISPTLVERGLLPGVSSEPQILLGERDAIRERRMVGRVRELGEMRNILIVALMGLLSAVLYAREPAAPVDQIAQASPMMTAEPSPWIPPPRRLPPGGWPLTQPPVAGEQQFPPVSAPPSMPSMVPLPPGPRPATAVPGGISPTPIPPYPHS